MIADVREFDYEGPRDDVKNWFSHEITTLETKLKEFEEKINEWKEKATDMSHKKAEEISDMIQTHLTDIQGKLEGKWNEANDKYQIEEKVHTIKKHYETLKKQLQK